MANIADMFAAKPVSEFTDSFTFHNSLCRRDVRAVMLRLPEVVELRRSLAGLLSVKRRVLVHS